MVYGIIELINFAHGDVFMVGAFMSLFFLTSSLGRSDFLGLHLSPTSITAGASIVLAAFAVRAWPSWACINVTIERFAYRPLRHAPRARAADHRDRRLVDPAEHHADHVGTRRPSTCRRSSRRHERIEILGRQHRRR